MADMRSIRSALERATARQRTFLTVYRLVLAVEAAAAVGLIVAPGAAGRVLALPAASMAFRMWGMVLLFTIVLQLPALFAPVHARFTIIAAVAGRASLTIGYLFVRCWLPAAAAGIATFALSATFARLLYAEIDRKP